MIGRATLLRAYVMRGFLIPNLPSGNDLVALANVKPPPAYTGST